LLSELLSLAGAISVTALTINYTHVVTRMASPWIWFDQTVAGFVIFIGLFLMLIVGVHVVIRRLSEVIKWERLHWAIQGLGLMLGALRGLWWSGVMLIILTSSGFTYLQESVQKRSVLGPRLVQVARESVPRIVDRFPGASLRGPVLVPPAKPIPKATNK
jgi:uncharacterized membrane protein required for colicin V production